MVSEKRVKMFTETAEYFPESIKSLLCLLPAKHKTAVTEIRLRAGRPLAVTLDGENAFISTSGGLCHLMQHGLYNVSADEVESTFRNMCDCSVYAYAEQIRAGYIMLKNGCRAGLAATAVYESGRITGFKSISSINVRLSCEFKDCAMPLQKYLNGGLLIAGPPSSGKTTLLRDAVRLISGGHGTERRRVAVIDSRGEIAANCGAVPGNDIGPLTDVITGCDKADGIEIALRTLNPQVIAFDEISNDREAAAVTGGFFGGADIVTTVHVGNAEELKKRRAAAEILKIGAVKYVAFVRCIGAVPEIYAVKCTEGSFELYRERQGVLSA